MMPAVRGDAMRGLAVFISDIRNCKSKEAEVKRINKELANIRSKVGFIYIRVATILGVAWSRLFSQKESESDSGFSSTI